MRHSVDEELERTADAILDKIRRCKESIVKN
jgi:hypothetical protein